MAYGIGDTLFDACDDIKDRLADGVTPEEASPYIKLITLMEALGGYWDRPPNPNPEYQRLWDAVVTAWNGIDITPVLAARQSLIEYCEKAATCESTGHRQLSPLAKRVDLEPIADEITDKIIRGEPDDRLRWLSNGRVRVEMGKIFPKGSGFKQTIEGRRGLLRGALIERLSTKGWVLLGRNTFGRIVPPTATS
jgi:hypothetical protein